MIAGIMAIYSMAITDSEEPVISYQTEVLLDKVAILVSFRRFVWDVASSWLEGILCYWIRNANVNVIWLIVLLREFDQLLRDFRWRELLLTWSYWPYWFYLAWISSKDAPILNRLAWISWRRYPWVWIYSLDTGIWWVWLRFISFLSWI